MSDQKRTLIFINLIITSFSSSLLATAMVVALPQIAIDLNVSLTTGQWVTSGFALASAIIMPLSAYFITRFPTRRLYLGSLFLIIIGLSICTVAQNFFTMIGGRVLQAVSGGILGAMAQVILLTVYPREQHGRVMGWYGLAMGVAPVIAPTLAGILMDLSSWRFVFVVTIVLMACSFLMAFLLFDNFLPNAIRKFDVYSFTLSAFAFGGITLGVGNMSNFGLCNIFSVVPLIVGLLAIVLFIPRQLTISEPLLDLYLFKNRTFSLAVVSGMLHNFIMMGAAILMPTYVQIIHGYNATQAGLFMFIPSVCFAVASPVAGKIYDAIGIKNLYVFSAVGLSISSWVMAFIPEATPAWVAMILYCLRNIALGLMMMPITTWGMSAIPKEQTAQGTALLNSMRNVCGAIGSAVVIGFMAMVSKIAEGSSHAVMYGFNGAFGFVGIFAIIMLMIAIFFVKPGKEL